MSTIWDNLELTGEVTLVLGWRPRPGSRHLYYGRVELKKDLADDLAERAKSWLTKLQNMIPIPYEGNVALEDDEYLEASIQALTSRAIHGLASRAEINSPVAYQNDEQSGVGLQELVENAFDSDNWLSSESLKSKFLLYAIVTRTSSRNPIAFIKQTSPQRLAKAGGRLTVFDNALGLMDRPIFVIEPDVDLVTTGDDLAILRHLAFDRVCADLELQKALIPEYTKVLETELPLASECAEVLNVECRKRARNATILRQLSIFTQEQWTRRTVSKIRGVLEQRQLNSADFISDDEELIVSHENAQQFLEVLTSRYYTSDFDNEERMADRSRLRR